MTGTADPSLRSRLRAAVRWAVIEEYRAWRRGDGARYPNERGARAVFVRTLRERWPQLGVDVEALFRWEAALEDGGREALAQEAAPLPRAPERMRRTRRPRSRVWTPTSRAYALALRAAMPAAPIKKLHQTFAQRAARCAWPLPSYSAFGLFLSRHRERWPYATGRTALAPREERAAWREKPRGGLLLCLSAKQLLVLLTRAGWVASEIAEALGVSRELLDVIVLTGGAPRGFAARLLALTVEPVPEVVGNLSTAVDHAALHASTAYLVASLSVLPETLARVWGPPEAAHQGGREYRPPKGWTRLEGLCVPVRMEYVPRGGQAAEPHGVLLHHNPKSGANRRARYVGWSMQDLAKQQCVRWPATDAAVARLPLTSAGLPPAGARRRRD